MSPTRAAVLGLCAFVAGSAAAQEPGDPVKGRKLAREICASCHGVEPSDRFSPKAGLATFRVIAGSPGITGIALAAFLQTPHRDMPDLIIARGDRDDLIAYILSLRDRRVQ